MHFRARENAISKLFFGRYTQCSNISSSLGEPLGSALINP